jgi:hypothetical protein
MFPAAKYANEYIGVHTGDSTRMPGRPLKRKPTDQAGPSSTANRVFTAEEEVATDDVRVEQVERAIREREMEADVQDNDDFVLLRDRFGDSPSLWTFKGKPVIFEQQYPGVSGTGLCSRK